MRSRGIVSLLAVLGALLAAPGAWAATLSVDDDGTDCPAAPFATIQAAIDAAAPGDVVAVCTGTYDEGSGAVGTNALTIAKDLTLQGMGADRVRIRARQTSPGAGRIAAAGSTLADGVGDVIAVTGTPARPVTVDISGVTVDGNGVVVEAGVVYADAQGTLSRSRVTNVVVSEAADAFGRPGGWRNAEQPGIGVAQVSGATGGAIPAPRTLVIENTRIDRYNAAGVVFQGAGASSGSRGLVVASEVVGRVLCQNFAANGDCRFPGLVADGPLFGQDGVQVTNRARATVRGSIVTQNLVNGTGAPVRQAFDIATQAETNPGTANNANLRLAAGIRLTDADAVNSLITRNNIVSNAYGVLNLAADGTASAGRVPAPDNWWGLRSAPPAAGSTTPNPGPAVDPTINPPVPENPVNAAVDFTPYRNGPQSDPRTGQFPNIQTAMSIDIPPAVSLAATPATAERGSEISLVATAGDDFGIRQVTFYEGATVIGTVPKPPYTASFRLPADGPCGPRTFVAVAEDALGQTSAATATIRVVTCPGTPPSVDPPAPRPAPTASIDPALRVIGQRGTVVPVAASSPAGVARVEWFLGTRLVCTDTTAPYSCRVVPRVSDVGSQSLRVVVTGRDGLSTTTARQVEIRRFAARGVRLSIKKSAYSRTRIRRTITATLLRPAGSTARQACAQSTMTLVVNKRYRAFVNQVRPMRSSCTVRLSFVDRRASKRIYSISARFRGNNVLLPAAKSRRFS